MTKQIYYYFAEESERLRYGDNRKIVVGKTHYFKGQPILCQQGLHASPTPWDALQYAPGPILYKVELGGIIVSQSDKSCATSRKYLAKIDANKLLFDFARWCALQVIHLWNCPDLVREWLETGNEAMQSASWSAARSAAESAARSAAESAARSAAESASWSAARSAARSAAESASWSAARSAAWSAAESAAWSAQQQKLLEMVTEAFKEAEIE